MTDEYAETVPRRDFEILETKYQDFNKTLDSLQKEHDELMQKYQKIQSKVDSSCDCTFCRHSEQHCDFSVT